MEEPKKVPAKLVNPIDYRLLLLIFVAAIGLQVYLYTLPDADADSEYAIATISALNPLAASIMGFIVSKRYHGSEVFGKAYFALGLAMLMIFLGEITYSVYDFVLDEEPYPSIADLFFLLAYPLFFYHLQKNIRFFKAKINLATKSLIVVIPLSIISAYSVLSISELGEASFDFYYGLLYVIGSSIVATAAILGAIVFRQGVLGTAWLVLAIGLLLNSAGDSWYTYLEIFGQYSLLHPVNLLWYSSYWVIVYSLIKHKDII